MYKLPAATMYGSAAASSAASKHGMPMKMFLPFQPSGGHHSTGIVQHIELSPANHLRWQQTHTGEARWTNMDSQCYEVISSGCAIVGFFVGYGVAQGKKHTDLCASRAGDAECTINWELMPPLCRADDVDAKNEKIAVLRQEKTEAAGRRRPSSAVSGDTDKDCAGDTDDDSHPASPFSVDYSV